MANPSTRKPLLEGVKKTLASMGGAKPAFAGAAAGALLCGAALLVLTAAKRKHTEE